MDKVEHLVGVAALNLGRELHFTPEELQLVRSLNPHELAEAQRRCLTRASAWKRAAKEIRRMANGKGIGRH
jgi:hypothetical protein